MAFRLAVAPISWGVTAEAAWGWRMPAERLLEEAAGVGLAAFEAGPDGYLPSDRPVVAGSTPPLVHRNQLPDLERRVRALEAAGAGVLVVGAGPHSLDSGGWARLLDALSAVEAVCRRHHLQIAVHPAFGSGIDTQRHLENLLVGTDYGICLDTGELRLCGIDPLELFELAASRVVHVHLKDLDRGLAGALIAGAISRWEAVFNGLIRPLGEGGTDVAGVVAALKDRGYGGWVVLEQDSVLAAEPPSGEGPIAGIGRSLRFLAAFA